MEHHTNLREQNCLIRRGRSGCPPPRTSLKYTQRQLGLHDRLEPSRTYSKITQNVPTFLVGGKDRASSSSGFLLDSYNNKLTDCDTVLGNRDQIDSIPRRLPSVCAEQWGVVKTYGTTMVLDILDQNLNLCDSRELC